VVAVAGDYDGVVVGGVGQRIKKYGGVYAAFAVVF